MPKILIVEDDPFISEIYLKKFSSSGYEAIPALSGHEALKKMREEKFDVVLLDIVLPELSGIEILREIRSGKEYNPGLKVLVFSNLSGPQERQEALSAGANGFISKTDFTPTQVVAEVDRYLGQFVAQETIKSPTVSPPTTVVPENSSDTSDKKILLIEDEPVFVEMFSKALRNAGYTVVTELDGKRGLERAQSEHFDLLITDHLLPSQNGREIITTLRSLPEKSDLPIFLLTASLEEEEIKAIEASGMVQQSFLKTQITPGELAQLAKKYLSA